ncbi:small subunit ribosomal protein S14 [Haloechinothrix alba]|uniref:Small ribosomal subunit protein uS14 n=1 Tax=Haloechinothrix alba TaxID=664784 RepID=A0A238X7T4_9PSEU|nr:30S ribosomal protein S14 [Haloechinothrix alba]SNR54682.1 small subunit ribosomal protein S14 [Haloechinothrix alba]
MTKKSTIAKDAERRLIVARHAARHAGLKAVVVSPRSTPEEKAEASAALQRMSRDAGPTRLRDRDVMDGRPLGHLRAFGLSRIRVREMAHRGERPGVSGSSW